MHSIQLTASHAHHRPIRAPRPSQHGFPSCQRIYRCCFCQYGVVSPTLCPLPCFAVALHKFWFSVTIAAASLAMPQLDCLFAWCAGCPPCKAFTPMLSAWFSKEGAAKNTQVVFASSDKDQSSFSHYLKEMSWDLAVPFGSAAKEALSAKFKVRGIPSVVIVDAKTGELITADAREGFMSNPAGFPFRPRSLEETFSISTVISNEGKRQTLAELASTSAVDYLVFYFSASWCGPCKGFTPRLRDWYTAHHASAPAGKTFEIVLVSGDRSQAAFEAYFAEMPWAALTFDCKDAAADFNKLFDVEGIPTLAVLDAKTKAVVTTDARPLLLEFPDEFPWLPTPVSRFAQALGSINDKKTVLLFTDKATASTADVETGFVAAATAYFGGDKDMQFVIATSEQSMSDRLRGFLGYAGDADGADSVRLVLLDIPAGCKYDLGSSLAALSKDGAVKAAVDGVFNGTTSPSALG